MPVYLNEPISFTQRFSEPLEYKFLLDKAADCVKTEPHTAMGYVIGFLYSGYLNTYTRTKKPFNPLWFETFDWVEDDLQYLTEQVSHHPPISACFGKTPRYEFWGDTRLKTNLGLAGMEIQPLGSYHVRFTETGDHITLLKPRSVVKNLIIGTTYVWQYGDMMVKNLKNGDTAVINFKEKGWTSSDDFKCDGVIKDGSGKIKYAIEGLWNQYLNGTNITTGQKVEFIKKLPPPDKQDWQYLFPKFSIQLNYLTQDTFDRVAPTDSRLRPDQRAYEWGDVKIAADEKLRLEEKQRAKRKIHEKSGVTPKAKWFVEDEDKFTGEMYFKYVGGYWEARETGNWPEDVEDLY